MNRRRFLKKAGLWVPAAVAFPGIVRAQRNAFTSPSQTANMMRRKMAACSTPTNGTYNEGFEGAPYEVTSPAWSAVGSPDTAYAVPGTGPTGSCSKCMRIVCGGSDTFIKNDWGAAKAGFGIRYYFYVAAIGAAGTINDVFTVCEGNIYFITASMRVQSLSGAPKLFLSDDGSNITAGWVLSLTTWYRIDFHGAPSTGTCYATVDGANEQSIASTNHTARYTTFGAGPLVAQTGWDWSMDIIQWKYSNAYIT